MCDVTFSAIWGMEDDYDTTVMKCKARELMLTKVDRSFKTSLLVDGMELVEMPLRYNKYVSCTCCISIVSYVWKFLFCVVYLTLLPLMLVCLCVTRQLLCIVVKEGNVYHW